MTALSSPSNLLRLAGVSFLLSLALSAYVLFTTGLGVSAMVGLGLTTLSAVPGRRLLSCSTGAWRKPQPS
jgi:hypothetical protein